MQSIDREAPKNGQLLRMATAVFLFTLIAVLINPTTRGADSRDAALQQVPLPYSFHDNWGTQWDVQADGCIGPGNADIFDAGGRLFLGNEQFPGQAQNISFDPPHNELIFLPQHMGGLNVSRRISVNTKDGWCRWVEVLENPTAQAIKTQVHVNIDLGGNVQSTGNITGGKSHHQTGLTVFDGTRGIAMLGCGRDAAVNPVFAPQQGNDQVDITWDVEAPAHKTIAIVHLQAIRANVNDAQTFLEKVSDADVLRNLPPSLLREIVNFAPQAASFGELDLLRGDLLDAVELTSGDQLRGTIQDKSFIVKTSYGMVTVPVDKALAMVAVGQFRPTQLVVTRDGEGFSGVLQSPMIHLQLSSGQVTPIPVGSIKRLGFRKHQNENLEFKYDRPMLMLRDGDRIAVEIPTDPIPVSTRYGNLMLSPQSVGALVFQVEDQPVHQLLLTDGSHIAALVTKDALSLRPLTTGADKPIEFPAAAVSRLQINWKVEEPGDQSPMLSLTTGDTLCGSLKGKLKLETAFDSIEIEGTEVRALHHAGTGPTELQITLWDDTSLSGRLNGDVVDMSLKSGPMLHVPAALIEEYQQPMPMPPQSVQQKVQTLVADLASDDWKRADRAASQLTSMGPHIAGALKNIRIQQGRSVQERIDSILGKLEPKPIPKPAVAPVAPNPPIDAAK